MWVVATIPVDQRGTHGGLHRFWPEFGKFEDAFDDG